MHGNFRGRVNRNNNSYREGNHDNYYNEHDQRYKDQEALNQNELDESRLVVLLENANLEISVHNDYRSRLRTNRGFLKSNSFRDDTNFGFSNSRNRGFESYGRPRGASRGFSNTNNQANYNQYDNNQDRNERSNRERPLSANDTQEDWDKDQRQELSGNIKHDIGGHNNNENIGDQRNRGTEVNSNRRKEFPHNYERNNNSRGFHHNFDPRQLVSNQSRQSNDQERKDVREEPSVNSNRNDDHRGSNDGYCGHPSRGMPRNQGPSDRPQNKPDSGNHSNSDNINHHYHNDRESSESHGHQHNSGQDHHNYQSRTYSNNNRNFDRRGRSESFRGSRNADLGGRARGAFNRDKVGGFGDRVSGKDDRNDQRQVGSTEIDLPYTRKVSSENTKS